MRTAPRTPGISIARLRTLILVTLVAGLVAFTGVMFTLVSRLSERFGPQVQADLEWRAQRGAQELARTADLGLAVSDSAMVTESFGAYARASDVRAIVAVDAGGKVVATHGQFDHADVVFAAPAGTLVRGVGYLASWVPATIEGEQVGKIAVVVSTQRMTAASAALHEVRRTTVIAGGLALVLGFVVILFFTRAVMVRDRQLGDYAANLEQKVEERTAQLDERNRGMRLVLDNVAQGFITVDLDGVMANERSAVVDLWFGAQGPDTRFADVVRPYGAFAAWFELGLAALREDELPRELLLEQLPRRFVAGARTFDVDYQPIADRDTLGGLLLIVSDVTAAIERERTEREQREMVELFQRISADRGGFDEFRAEADGLVARLRRPDDPVVEKRAIHTLKGNCGIYGLHGFADHCHQLETELAESGDGLSEEQRSDLAEAWAAVTARLAHLLGERKHVIEIGDTELTQVITKAREGVSSRDLATLLDAWRREPVAVRFERLGRQATALARRLGKGPIEVVAADHQLRLDAGRWHAFWGAMIHAVRNAVDHGVESPDERAAAGKPAVAKLTLSARRADGELTITLADDGRGLDWDRVRAKAAQLGLPHATRADLTTALFHDGLSTRDQASELSGRGVGLAALRAAVLDAGGSIDVESALGAGTQFRFRFPDLDAIPLRPPTQPMRRVG